MSWRIQNSREKSKLGLWKILAKNSDYFFTKLRVFAEKLRVKTEKTQVKNAKTQVSRDPQILPNTKNRSKNKPGSSSPPPPPLVDTLMPWKGTPLSSKSWIICPTKHLRSRISRLGGFVWKIMVWLSTSAGNLMRNFLPFEPGLILCAILCHLHQTLATRQSNENPKQGPYRKHD